MPQASYKMISTRRNCKLWVALLLLLIFLHPHTFSQETKSAFRDTTDNAFDVSSWLLQKKGFLIVPSIITEPAIGYGGALGVIFFHSSFLERKGPPNMSGLIAGATENGTWMGGIYHRGFWFEDRLRYTGVLMRTSINMNFYGSGSSDILEGNPIRLNMDAWVLLQQLSFRISRSNFFLGGRYLLMSTQNTFQLPVDVPEFSGIDFQATLSEISFLLNYDTRNNVFTPTKGIYAEIIPTYSDTWLGGEALYGRMGMTLLAFTPISNRVIMGLRLESHYSLGDVPFWARPMVNMRGVPLMKYQNKDVGMMEAEFSWNIYKRWHLLGFTGMGNAFTDFASYNSGKSVHTLGTGFRYEIARIFGVQMGMDFAWSNEDFAFYFMFGHAWSR